MTKDEIILNATVKLSTETRANMAWATAFINSLVQRLEHAWNGEVTANQLQTLLERQAAPLTKADMAEALGCFWNAAIGAAHSRQGGMDFAAIMAEGISAVSPPD